MVSAGDARAAQEDARARAAAQGGAVAAAAAQFDREAGDAAAEFDDLDDDDEVLLYRTVRVLLYRRVYCCLLHRTVRGRVGRLVLGGAVGRVPRAYMSAPPPASLARSRGGPPP